MHIAAIRIGVAALRLDSTTAINNVEAPEGPIAGICAILAPPVPNVEFVHNSPKNLPLGIGYVAQMLSLVFVSRFPIPYAERPYLWNPTNLVTFTHITPDAKAKAPWSLINSSIGTILEFLIILAFLFAHEICNIC